MTVAEGEGSTTGHAGSNDAADSPVLWAGRISGAALLVWMAWIHLHLWSEGYRHLATIGPLFMANFVAAMVVALLLLSVPRRRLLAAVAGVGAVLAGGTLAGLALSINIGLFGFTESWNAGFTHMSVAVEIAAALVLVATGAGAAFRSRRRD
jgi:hypothetical protein